MKQKMNRKPWLMLLGVTLLTGTTLLATSGCSNNGYRSAPPVYKPVYYYPYDYYYYPSMSVYFHISSGYYYYRDGRSWLRVRTLPPRFYLDPVDRIRLVVKSDRPYINHEQHRLRYTPRPTYKRDVKRNQVERRSNTNRYNQYQKNQRRKR